MAAFVSLGMAFGAWAQACSGKPTTLGICTGTGYDLVASSKISPAVIQRRHKALEFSLKDKALKSPLEAAGFQPVPDVPTTETRKFVRDGYKKWTQVISTAGITLD